MSLPVPFPRPVSPLSLPSPSVSPPDPTAGSSARTGTEATSVPMSRSIPSISHISTVDRRPSLPAMPTNSNPIRQSQRSPIIRSDVVPNIQPPIRRASSANGTGHAYAQTRSYRPNRPSSLSRQSSFSSFRPHPPPRPSLRPLPSTAPSSAKSSPQPTPIQHDTTRLPVSLGPSQVRIVGGNPTGERGRAGGTKKRREKSNERTHLRHSTKPYPSRPASAPSPAVPAPETRTGSSDNQDRLKTVLSHALPPFVAVSKSASVSGAATDPAFSLDSFPALASITDAAGSTHLPPPTGVRDVQPLGMFTDAGISKLYSPISWSLGKARAKPSSTPVGYVYDPSTTSMPPGDTSSSSAIGSSAALSNSSEPLEPIPASLTRTTTSSDLAAPLPSIRSFDSIGSLGSLPDLTTSYSHSETSFSFALADAEVKAARFGEMSLGGGAPESEEFLQDEAERALEQPALGLLKGVAARSTAQSKILPPPPPIIVPMSGHTVARLAGASPVKHAADPERLREHHHPLADLRYWSSLLLANPSELGSPSPVPATSSTSLSGLSRPPRSNGIKSRTTPIEKNRPNISIGESAEIGDSGSKIAGALQLEKERMRWVILRERVQVFHKGWKNIDWEVTRGLASKPEVELEPRDRTAEEVEDEVDEVGAQEEREEDFVVLIKRCDEPAASAQREAQLRQRWDEMKGLVSRLMEGIEWLDVC